jgi:ParB-like chromosome segregation protein Spo0J
MPIVVGDEGERKNTEAQLTVHKVAIRDLSPGDSPRQKGIDEAHVARLVECNTELPPILVHRETMRVIDGMHRLSAAMRRGHNLVDVTYFDGDDHDAFILAVESNIKHGLPLSLSDRKAAALRILAADKNLSDRAIALKTGLSDKTVAKIRVCSGAEIPHVDTRRGRDGRVYPVGSIEARQRIMQLITERPEATLREIAAAVGVSATTVSNVRKRLQTDHASVHAGPDTKPGENPGPGSERSTMGLMSAGQAAHPAIRAEIRGMDIDIKQALGRLSADPSIRGKESGRELLRWLSGYAIEISSLPEITSIPSHRRELVALIVRQSARAWLELGRRLEAAEVEGDVS